MQTDYRMCKDSGVFLGWQNDRLMDDRQEPPDDQEIMEMMGKTASLLVFELLEGIFFVKLLVDIF